MSTFLEVFPILSSYPKFPLACFGGVRKSERERESERKGESERESERKSER